MITISGNNNPQQSLTNLSQPVDFDSASFIDRGAKKLVNDAFKFYTGRDATEEETKSLLDKYGSGNAEAIVSGVYQDHGGSYVTPSPASNDQMQDYRSPVSQFLDAEIGTKNQEEDHLKSNRYVNASINEAPGRTQDAAQFLTKMAPDQTAEVFKSVGLDDGSARRAADIIASRDWSSTKEGDLPAELGKLIPSLDDRALTQISKAMFGSDRSAWMGTPDGFRMAAPGDADHNNRDYSKYTKYDPERGVGFTGGYVPEPSKRDWLGDIVLGTLLGGVGYIGGLGVANALTSALPGLATTGYAGAAVPGMLAKAAGGAIAGSVTGGLNSNAHGGSFAKGAGVGGIMGGLSGVGNIKFTDSSLVNSALNGAGRGAIASSLSGGSAATGAISGAAGGVAGNVANSTIGNRFVTSFASSGVNELVKAALRGDEPDKNGTTIQQTATRNPVGTVTIGRR